jgi:hypothetical protein
MTHTNPGSRWPLERVLFRPGRIRHPGLGPTGGDGVAVVSSLDRLRGCQPVAVCDGPGVPGVDRFTTGVQAAFVPVPATVPVPTGV